MYEPPPQKGAMGTFVGWLLFLGLIVLLFFIINRKNSNATQIAMSEFHARLQADQVTKVVVSGDELIGEFDKPYAIGSGVMVQTFRVVLPTGTAGSWQFTQWLLENRKNASVEANNDQGLLLSIVVPLVPWLFILMFIWFFVFRRLRKVKPGLGGPMPVYIVPAPTGVTEKV